MQIPARETISSLAGCHAYLAPNRTLHAHPKLSRGHSHGPQRRLRSHADESHEAQPDAAPTPNELTDWRSFRAHLVALERTSSALTEKLAQKPADHKAWAHELGLPEKGCLLLGRREDMAEFTHTVVLLCQHDSIGSSGFVINMPLPRHIIDASIELELSDNLRGRQVCYGGPCRTNSANLLHTCDEVKGATEIIQALYVGGLEDVNKKSRLGQLVQGQMQLLIGCAAWSPGQLQSEVQAGCWHVVAASSNLLHDCLFGEQEADTVQHRDQIWQKVLKKAGIAP